MVINMAREFAKAFYKSKEWRITREYILKRDNYLCVKCGAPAEEVHHIIHLRPDNIDNPQITLNADNLICLCKDCHFAEHYRDKAEGHRTSDRQHELDVEQYEFNENGFLVLKESPL